MAFLKKGQAYSFYQCVGDTVLVCVFKNLNHLEGVWPKHDVTSWLSYGCCWGLQGLSLKSQSCFPVQPGLSKKFLFIQTESVLPQIFLHYTLLSWDVQLLKEKLCSSTLHMKTPLQEKLSSSIWFEAWSFQAAVQKLSVYIILRLCSCFNSMLMQMDWAFPRSLEVAWKTS